MAENILPPKGGMISFKINIDGSEISSTYQVISLDVTKEINRIPTASIMLQDGDPSTGEFEATDSDDFKPGNEIEIALGYDGDNEVVFKGIITKIRIKIRRNGDSVLMVEAKNKAIKMTVGRKSKYFYESKDSDVMSEIMGEYGDHSLSFEDTVLEHPELVQYRSTDWDFVLSRVEANGKICFVDDDFIIVQAPNPNLGAQFTLQFGTNVYSFDASIDARDQLKNVTAQGWDFGDQEIIVAEAQEPSIDGMGNLSAEDLADVIGTDPYVISHGGKTDQAELQAWADAQLLRNRMAKIQGNLSIQGNAEITPTNTIELDGFGERFNGKIYVSAIKHQVEDGNWITYIQFGMNPEWFTETYEVSEKEASGLFPAIQGLQVGLVTQLKDDPDGEERILVRLPMINPEEQGIWARVSCLDAGENRGTFFRPEIGDEVIVGFINDDPNDAIILGMMNSSAKPAPLVASDDNHEKGIFTRSKMKILFNDDEESITIKNDQDNQVLITDSSIELSDKNGNKIIMNEDGIEINSAKDIILNAQGDLKADGLNVEISALAQAKISGNAGAELSTSAIAVVKGSLVQIN
ncbi:MAG: type VI secretion system tip protein VgrG [Saprospiraceae bacterium]